MDSNLKLSNNEDVGILLLSHGSSLPYAEETFNEICEKFKEATGLPTIVGYMKVSSPLIPEAISQLKEDNPNIKRILALPVFLAKGIHTQIDIPTILGLEPLEEDPRCPDGNYPDGHYLSNLQEIDFDGEIKLLEPFGPDKKLIDFINKRIDESLKESKLDNDSKTGILLVSHGSRLNYNKEFISEVHRLFDESTDYINSFGFMELVEPDIPESVNKLVDNNDIDRLIVVPVFIAPGVHTTQDIPTILGLKEEEEHSHSHEHGHGHHHHHHHGDPVDFDGEILYPEPLGADEILINILIDKVKESI